MKKILLVIILFLLPFSVSAADYDIKGYYINADILEDGDVFVTELFVLEGDFNGYIRDIMYANYSAPSYIDFEYSQIYNASGISDLLVYGRPGNADLSSIDDGDFIKYELVNYGFNGDNYVYELTNTNGLTSVKMYDHTSGTTTFALTYELEDVIVIHEDVAELYYNFVGNDFADDIENIEIKVNLPLPDNSDNFRVWAQGGANSLSGTVEKIDNYGLYATIKDNKAYEPITIRLTFDKNLLFDTSNLDTTDEIALPQIIEVENIRANEANEIRENIKKQYNFSINSAYSLIVLSIIVIAYIYVKYDKERKSKFIGKYNREFIEDYDVEVIDYLFNKNITPNAFSASLLNLIYKKNISFIEIEKNKDYEFTLVSKDNLSKSELILVDLLFVSVGENEKFTTAQLKKYAGGYGTASEFALKYHKWSESVLEEAKKHNFYENNSIPHIFGVINLIITMFVVFYAMSIEINSSLPYIAGVIGLIAFGYCMAVKKKTVNGIEHFSKWKAFKNFLKDFGKFDSKTLPEITLWERYLVYATILGVADKLRKNMEIKVKELDSNYHYGYYGYGIVHSRIISNSINSAVSSAQMTSANANSSSSSGSGFGGGFSSGGGFGGGGGGGRGF